MYDVPDVHPIYYPVKKMWREQLADQPARAGRRFDVSLFIPIVKPKRSVKPD